MRLLREALVAVVSVAPAAILGVAACDGASSSASNDAVVNDGAATDGGAPDACADVATPPGDERAYSQCVNEPLPCPCGCVATRMPAFRLAGDAACEVDEGFTGCVSDGPATADLSCWQERETGLFVPSTSYSFFGARDGWEPCTRTQRRTPPYSKTTPPCRE